MESKRTAFFFITTTTKSTIKQKEGYCSKHIKQRQTLMKLKNNLFGVQLNSYPLEWWDLRPCKLGVELILAINLVCFLLSKVRTATWISVFSDILPGPLLPRGRKLGRTTTPITIVWLRKPSLSLRLVWCLASTIWKGINSYCQSATMISTKKEECYYG